MRRRIGRKVGGERLTKLVNSLFKIWNSLSNLSSSFREGREGVEEGREGRVKVEEEEGVEEAVRVESKFGDDGSDKQVTLQTTFKQLFHFLHQHKQKVSTIHSPLFPFLFSLFLSSLFLFPSAR